ncbi:MAG TPA: signal peptidase II [Verrucomicrobiae bacterium]|jgi:signal peptidase II
MKKEDRRLLGITLAVVLLDQATKMLVPYLLGPSEERVVIDGFFRLVYWMNTGAAWSLLRGRNYILAGVSIIALAGLYSFRRHFYVQSLLGQISLGLIFGGIIGNLLNRLMYHHVIDFLRFYLIRRSGEEVGFPAFNIADSAICIGVGLLIILSWKREHESANGQPAGARLSKAD